MKTVLDEINEMFDEALKNADYRTLGQRLIEERTSYHLNQNDIAGLAKLSIEIIKKLENDEINDLMISEVKKLCLAYRVSPNLFINYLAIDS